MAVYPVASRPVIEQRSDGPSATSSGCLGTVAHCSEWDAEGGTCEQEPFRIEVVYPGDRGEREAVPGRDRTQAVTRPNAIPREVSVTVDSEGAYRSRAERRRRLLPLDTVGPQVCR